jgi:DNA-binding NarL/FixJ family response regulator
LASSRRVLVVDDQDIMVTTVKALLEASEEIEVVGSAWNGQEALKLVEELSPDVVLMDIDMPVMDGVEATRQIAGRFPATQVVILTGLYEPDRIDLALRAGAVSQVTKNQMATQLIATVLAVESSDTVQPAS